ncbi:hypothetical protein [Flavobacterium sp. 3HN19-14]|uniref:hypothetical protein n=1 Tax=Flavobacterium sp. 3HN19-14 TaxID=3448133 RepID=UPI003EDE96D6
MKTKIISLQAAFEAKGYNPNYRPDVSECPEHLKDRQIANFELDVLIEALNDEDQPEHWEPDYTDWNADKFENWYDRDIAAPSGWSLDDVDGRDTHTAAGARRSFRTREIGNYVGTKFIDLVARTL